RVLDRGGGSGGRALGPGRGPLLRTRSPKPLGRRGARLMATAGDHYDAYYADKLWARIPALYRAEDSEAETERGPLRELVERIGAQAAVLRRSIDRTWEDQSIET